MQHYVLPDWPYAQAFAALAATGWKLNLQSTIHAGGTKKPDASHTKFTCPNCGRSVRGKPDTTVGCKPCGYLDMLPPRAVLAIQSYEQAGVSSYDQQAAWR
jgi:predicted RNA-binding Zn-ribbon protein involved in translation (DUF1610 family)